MFDEFVINETQVDNELEMLTDYECECGTYLEKDWDGTLFCRGCGNNYSIETTTYNRREVN